MLTFFDSLDLYNHLRCDEMFPLVAPQCGYLNIPFYTVDREYQEHLSPVLVQQG